MLPPKVQKYLDAAGVKYESVPHRKVFTAYDAAQTLKVKLDEIVKNLFVKIDRDYYLVLLPASKNLDLKKLENVVKKLGKSVKVIKLPGEKIMQEVLKLKKGAMSAFGKLHEVSVIIEKELLKKKKAFFSSGSFVESIKMAVKDFVKMEKPIVGSFGVKKIIKAFKKTSSKTVSSKGGSARHINSRNGGKGKIQKNSKLVKGKSRKTAKLK